MGVWDRIRGALRREQRDVQDALDDLERLGNAALDERERELRATPAERFAIEQQRAADADAELEAIRRRIEGDATP